MERAKPLFRAFEMAVLIGTGRSLTVVMYVAERVIMRHNAGIAQNPDSIATEAMSMVMEDTMDVVEVDIEVDIVMVTEGWGAV